MRHACLSLVLVLASCGTDLSSIDEDEDGYGLDVDCDDSDPTVHPDAEELCDEIDNNCDGISDLDATNLQTFYADADGDGFYGEAVTTQACTVPDGFGTIALDCDDLDADTNPDGAEVCDGVDNDCDDLIDDDDDDVDATTLSEWFADADGDGWGTNDVYSISCEAPSGYVDVDGDCDDSDADLNPGTVWYADVDADGYGADDYTSTGCNAPAGYVAAGGDCDDLDDGVNPDATEVCDGVDNDCDEAVDDDDDSVDSSTWTTWYADSDADGYGDEETSSASCEAPSSYVEDASDCDDSDGEVNPGATEVCDNGVDDDCSGDASGCTLTGEYDDTLADLLVTSSSSGDYTGAEMTAGDYDGDGVTDLVVSSYYANSGRGSVSLFWGPVTADADISSADATWVGDGTYDYAGKFMESGDLDGDGYDDLVVAAYGNDADASGGGAVYVIYGSTGWSGSMDLEDADAVVRGQSSYDSLGESLVLADLDGDGYVELVHGITSYDSASSSSGEGAVGIWPGDSSRLSGEIDGDDAPILLIGEDNSDYLGDDRSLGAVDADGDGLMDLLLGATGEDTTGAAAGATYLVYGMTSASTGSYTVTDVASVTWYGDNAGEKLGSAVNGVGDIDGDGYDDLAMGAADADDGAYTSVGKVFLVHGSSTGAAGGTVSDIAFATFIGGSSYDGAGTDDVTGGDFDDDGYSDFVAGSNAVDPNGNNAGGAAYLMYGPFTGTRYFSDADASFVGAAAADNLGKSVLAADVDDDGIEDLVVGAYGAEEALIFLGSGL